MINSRFLFSLIMILFSGLLAVHAQLPAFPGAEGFGKYASGGRGGTVYHVTNLNDAGPGSLRDAVSQPNRIVVFDVGGVINISSRIVFHKNVTVAGQTAPGGGITIYGNGIALNDDSGNSIIRYIRIRMGKNGDSQKDAVGISAGTNYMFDHVSVSWGRDGTFDINGSTIDNVSIQDCIISQGINNDNHSTGGLMQSGHISIIRTLWIDNKTRNPKGRGPIEYINSVIYNWRDDGFIMGDTEGLSECNLIGNYFIAGPESSTSRYISRTTPSFNLYPEDNWLDADRDGSLNGTKLSAAEGDYNTATIKAVPFSYPGVQQVLSAEDAVTHIIYNAGASLARDTVDVFLINQLKSFGTLGKIINTEDDNGIPGNVGTVNNGPKPADSDGDGMPDDWEDANGTDKTMDDAMVISPNGYANIENYFNTLPGLSGGFNPPLNLNGVATGDDKIQLGWTDLNYLKLGSVLERSTDSLNFVRIDSLDTDVQNYTDTNLLGSTTYYYRLHFYNDTTVSDTARSAGIKTFPEGALPGKAGLVSPADNATEIPITGTDLSWSKPEYTLSFNVYTGSSGSALELKETGYTRTEYNTGELGYGKDVFWRIDAVNENGVTEGDVWKFSTPDPPEVQLAGYWPFNESQGTQARDSSEYQNHGELQDIAEGIWVSGRRKGALSLANSTGNGHLLLGKASQLNMGDNSFSIAFWMRLVSISDTSTYIFHKGSFSAFDGTVREGKWFGLEMKDNDFRFAVDDNVTKTTISTTKSGFVTGEWIHVIIIRNRDTKKVSLYKNGDLLSEVSDNTGDISSDMPFVIGNSDFMHTDIYVGTLSLNTNYRGELDEFVICRHALSAEEIDSLYTYNQVPGMGPIIPGVNNFRAFDFWGLKAYPNPFSDEVHLEFNTGTQDHVILDIYDIHGKLINRFKRSVIPNTRNTLTWNGKSAGQSPLSKGIYLLVLSDNSGKRTGRSLVLKK